MNINVNPKSDGTAFSEIIDPIFAAIETHRVAWEKFERASEIADKIYKSMPVEMQRTQRVLVGQDDGGNPIYANSHEEIDAFFKKHVSSNVHPRLLRIAEIHDELDRDHERLKAAKDACGCTVADEETEALCDASVFTSGDVLDMHPTTLQGFAAKLRFLAEDEVGEFGDEMFEQLNAELSNVI